MKTKKKNKNYLEHKCIRAKEQKSYAPMRFCSYALLSCALLFFSGCNSDQRISELKTEINNLTTENNELKSEIEQINTDNNDLEKRIVVLQNLPDNVKGINLYQLENVKIQNFSGFFDENNDGKFDTLVVRVQPVDNYGDVIKAAGSVDVELWNLNKPADQSLIDKWQVGVDDLKKDWVSAWGITNYRLSFDVADKIENFDQTFTIKMDFTDYLSGKVFQAQKVIEP